MSAHVYLSTAYHHDLHSQCQHECRFCEVPCACPCHQGPEDYRFGLIHDAVITDDTDMYGRSADQ